MQSEKKLRRILIVCPYPVGVAAGQRLKYEQYIDHWRRNGIEVDIAPFMDMALWNRLYLKGKTLSKVWGTLKGQARRIRDAFRLRSYDAIYLFMWVTPVGTSFFERWYRSWAKKVIYDVEDNIFVEKGNELNPLAKMLKGVGKTEVLVSRSDHIITSSPFLNEYCLKINERRRCTFISSSVDADRYIAASKRDQNVPLTIGWTGTFTSRRFLDQLRPVFLRLRENRNFRLVVIGNFEYEFPEMDLEVIQWTKEKEIADLQQIDIGVYPLPKEDWVLGKSGLKVIQYMAMSLPTVSTNYGTAMDIVDDGVSGFLANTEDDWVEMLTKLIDDVSLRQAMGSAARKVVESRYSIEAIKSQYLSVLNEVLSS